MEIKKCKKWGSALLCLLAIAMIIPNTGFVKADDSSLDVQVNFSESYDQDQTSSTVKITAYPLREQVIVESIELPNGRTVEGDQATYLADENGDLSFIVNYVEETLVDVEKVQSNLEESDIHEEETPSEDEQTSTNEVQKQYRTSYKVEKVTAVEEIKESADEKADNYSLKATKTMGTFVFDKATKTITAYKKISDDDVVVPNTIDGVSVEHIAGYTFYNLNLNTLTLPDTLKDIQSFTFYKTIIKQGDLVIPDSVSTIDPDAAHELQIENGGLIFGKGLTRLGNGAFSYASFLSLKFASDADNKLTAIPTGAFIPSGNVNDYKNDGYKLVLPEGIGTIGENAFGVNGGSGSLKEVVIPSTVGEIGNYAFSNNKIETLTFKAGLNNLAIRRGTFAYNNIAELDLSMTKATLIEESAFVSNQIETLKLSDNIDTIGRMAFYNNKLKQLNMPSTLRALNNRAFALNQIEKIIWSPNLQQIGYRVFGEGNSLYYLDFENGAKDINFIGEYEYPNTGPQFVQGKLIDMNIITETPYIIVNGKKVISIDMLYPGLDKSKLSIDTSLYPGLDYSQSSTGIWYDEINGYIMLPDVIPASFEFAYIYHVMNKNNNTSINDDGGSRIIVQDIKQAHRVEFDYHTPGVSNKISGVLNGKMIPEPIKPERTDYEFIGWYKDSAYTDQWDFQTDVVTSDLTLHAKWGKKVTFDAQGGKFTDADSESISLSLGIGEKISGIPSFAHPDGFKFVGWYKEAACINVWDIANDVVNDNITLYAKWEFDELNQDPTMLITIPSEIKLVDESNMQYASAMDSVTIVSNTTYDQWIPDKLIDIKTDTSIKLISAQASSIGDILVYDALGNEYKDATQPLMTITPYGSNGYKKSETFMLRSRVDKLSRSEYKGIMKFYIDLR